MTVEGSSTRGITTRLDRGTQCYCAPELFRPHPTFTTKVDIFAIGYIIFEFMTGQKAFANDLAVYSYATGSHWQLDFSLSQFRTSATAFLKNLIYQSLSRHVEERPSATTLLQKLTLLPASARGSHSGDSNWVVADDDALVHVRIIGCGGLARHMRYLISVRQSLLG